METELVDLGKNLILLVREARRQGLKLSEVTVEVRRRWLIELLLECRGNACRAARRMKMHRNTFARHLEALSIDASQYRASQQRKPVQSAAADGGEHGQRRIG